MSENHDARLVGRLLYTVTCFDQAGWLGTILRIPTTRSNAASPSGSPSIQSIQSTLLVRGLLYVGPRGRDKLDKRICVITLISAN